MMYFVASFLLVFLCGGTLINQSVGLSVTNRLAVRPLAMNSPSSCSPYYLPYSNARFRMHLKATSDDTNETPLESDKDDETTFRERIRKLWVKKDADDGLTTRQRLAKMGLAAVLSYGWVSNLSYVICVSIAWYLFSKKTGLSPLAPNQWKPFLAVYAGFYVFNNIVRPFRLGLSVAISQYFDNVISFVERKTNFSRSIAIALVVFLFNIVGTLSLMTIGISLASMASGVPIFPSKVA